MIILGTQNIWTMKLTYVENNTLGQLIKKDVMIAHVLEWQLEAINDVTFLMPLWPVPLTYTMSPEMDTSYYNFHNF
jgi:hypothetical protein